MRRFSRWVVPAVLFGLLAVFTLGGCGGSEPTAQEQLCDSVAGLDDAAAALGALSLDSTRGEVQQTVDGFVGAVQDVAADVGAVVESDVDVVQESFDGLATQLGSLPENATVGETVAVVQRALPQLRTALDGLGSAVDCGG
jgi:uncharacterized protein YdbL (DUF1318 family)